MQLVRRRLSHDPSLGILTDHGRARLYPSAEDVLHHVRRLDARKPKIESLEAVGEALVVDAEQVHHGSVQIADVDGILRYVEAELVGCGC